MRTLLPLLIALLCAAAPATARGYFGVVADGPLTAEGAAYPGEWQLIRDSGALMARTTFSWPALEPSRGSYDYRSTDAVVGAAAAQGIVVLPVVERTPRWAKADPRDASSPPREPGDYATLLRRLVARYGPAGTYWAAHPEFRPQPIRAWQVWNEPNLPRYWSPQPFAKGYVRLLRGAAKAIRESDPGARVVLAGLPNEAWTALRKLYRARAKGHFDVVAVHPYTGKPRNVITYVEYLRKVMRRFDDNRRSVWLTELSWPASKGKTRDIDGFTVTDAQQASRLREAARRIARHRKRLRIGRVFWYTWLSPPEGSENAFDYSGLRRLQADGSIASAPALEVFARAARSASSRRAVASQE